MDQKTLDWFNERTKKGNEIQTEIKLLKKEIEKVRKNNGVCIGFYTSGSNNWQDNIAYNCNSDKYRQFLHEAIAEPLIAAFEKEIEELEAEFAEL